MREWGRDAPSFGNAALRALTGSPFAGVASKICGRRALVDGTQIHRADKMYADTLLILFISICTALLGEGMTWVLVYRTDKYKKLKSEVEKQSKKLEKQKESVGESTERSVKKKLERQEERLKNNNRDLSLVKMKSMFAIGFAFTSLLSMFNSIFDGRVVARLPFVPISLIQNLSHRNLSGDDYTDCSFIFLYILCTMAIRQNIQKMLGFAPSRAANKQGGLFAAPPQATK